MLRCAPGWRRVLRAASVPASLVALAALVGTGCHARAGTEFALGRAARHVRILSSTIGCRPTGSEANRRAREYAAGQLRAFGLEVRLQEALAFQARGMTTPVVNIVATRAGRQPEAVALVSHYDSPPESRGAADDALGVAVCLEAARVLAQRANPRYGLVVALTDGEELGLMGARALVTAPEFARVRAFLNVEAVGTTGPARLFQAGPGNPWLAGVWARSAPYPAGSSLDAEVYRHLPNDTDFTVLTRSGLPGLNFAPVGNTFAYHTPLDTPERLDRATLSQLGANVLAVVTALDRVDIRTRAAEAGTYFDAAGEEGFAYSSRRAGLLAAAACLLGLAAAWRAFRAARSAVGLLRVAVTVVWTAVTLAVMAGTLCGACWLLRAASRAVNPWYAQVALLAVFLAVVAFTAVWVCVLFGRTASTSVAPCGKPACVWMIALPAWTVVTALAQHFTPGASYLIAWPLVVASVPVLVLPVDRDSCCRLATALTLAVGGVLWLPLAWTVFPFAVGVFGFLPIVAPVWLFPAAAMASLLVVGPSLAGLLLGRDARGLPSSAVSSLLGLAVVGLAWTMSVEPAYTAERPERRVVRYVQDMIQQKALWEIGTHEPDPEPAGSSPRAPHSWQNADEPPAVSLRIGPVAGPFRYRARGEGLVAPPLAVHSVARSVEGTADVWLETTAVPGLEGTGAVFALPWGVRPIESNLPGVVENGRWRAAVIPTPAGGATLRVRLRPDALARLPDGRIVAVVNGLPGGTGWQRLPPWLPQTTCVWTARSYFLLPWPPSQPGNSPAGNPEPPGAAHPR